MIKMIEDDIELLNKAIVGLHNTIAQIGNDMLEMKKKIKELEQRILSKEEI